MQTLNAERQSRAVACTTLRITLETPLTTQRSPFSSCFHINNKLTTHSTARIIAATWCSNRIFIVINTAFNS